MDVVQKLIADIHVPMRVASMAHAYGLDSSNTMLPIPEWFDRDSFCLCHDTRIDALVQLANLG